MRAKLGVQCPSASQDTKQVLGEDRCGGGGDRQGLWTWNWGITVDSWLAEAPLSSAVTL
jgi:hypothetical protein